MPSVDFTVTFIALLVATPIFLLAGSVKLSPLISATSHQTLSEKFETIYTPFLLQQLSRLNVYATVSSISFRQLVGAAEVVIAIMLIVKPYRKVGAFFGLSIMAGAAYVEKSTNGNPVAALLVGCCCLLVLIYSKTQKIRSNESSVNENKDK